MVNVSEVVKGTRLEPRPYQLRIVNKVVEMFTGTWKNQQNKVEIPARSILLESPTGSGKTSMAWLAAKALQAAVPELAVGWVAMRRNLLVQAAKENAAYHQVDNPTGKDVCVNKASLISMFDNEPTEIMALKKQGHKVLLVVDECQHDSCSSMAHLHNLIEPDYVLGLSATPFRTDRVKLTFDKVIKDAGIYQLISDGYLSTFDHYSIENWKVETVAATYLREPERWGKSIFYFVNLEQCFDCSRLLAAAGVANEVVTGDTDVEAQLKAFRDGTVKVLINCMKLTEGFDDPSLQTAFVRDSGKGCTMQMAGRVLRKFAGLPSKQIVQSAQTRWPMIRTALPVQQLVWQNGQWLSLTVNPRLNLINNNARKAIAQAEVTLPTFLTDKKRRVKKLTF